MSSVIYDYSEDRFLMLLLKLFWQAVTKLIIIILIFFNLLSQQRTIQRILFLIHWRCFVLLIFHSCFCRAIFRDNLRVTLRHQHTVSTEHIVAYPSRMTHSYSFMRDDRFFQRGNHILFSLRFKIDTNRFAHRLVFLKIERFEFITTFVFKLLINLTLLD